MKRVIDSKTQQECITTSVLSPKPNQVGTVLLYGIPIVSLYIESQERLCLAQISNTLLKQYSYNEIHNRRVALGITCVQCTPVQLEILRRAGAMPVSSRRCGMITRREAERLCKSFLGDNAPPRLPEDFAFSVHHECAWGCRGSFLPARYNSSRAKCIKCAYCGLFFSPNKFIFHSHRIGPGDKYVQPDAANFNSWRRHMKLSGNPPEEIVHAWEDVKAMFNGGTRKRLIISSSSSGSNHGVRNSSSLSSPKRLKESTSIGSQNLSPPLIHAAAAVTVVSAASSTPTTTANQLPIRPVQLLPNGNAASSVNNMNPLATSASAVSPSSGVASTTPTSTRLPPLCSDLSIPFTRGFMMDYMWHTQTKASAFQFSNYALPWIKRPGTLFLNQQHQSSQHLVNGNSITTSVPAIRPSVEEGGFTSTESSRVQSASSSPPSSKSSLPFYNNSAFRPVVNHHSSHRPTQGRPNSGTVPASTVYFLEDDQQTSSSRNSRDDGASGSATIKESLSSDDEMVDIETTEDDEEHQRRNHRGSGSIHYQQHIDDLITVKVPKSSTPTTVDVEIPDEINCWDGAAAEYLKKRLSCRNLANLHPPTTPSPTLVPSHSSPASSSSCGGGSDGSSGGGGDMLPRDHHHGILRISSAPSGLLDPMSAAAVTSTGSAAAAAAAAAAVAIAAFSQSSPPTSPPLPTTTPVPIGAKSTYDGTISPVPLTQNAYHCDKTLTNTLYNNLIRNSNVNHASNNNNINNNRQIKTGSDSRGSPNSTADQLCSVARLSFDRMEYNSLPPFYRHDITKHFQSFRHHGEQTQTNGGIG
ncbi:flocculation protein FLO11 [Hermetia illucens]|nr:flocculation protein FLO11 [Hermetia illucens]